MPSNIRVLLIDDRILPETDLKRTLAEHAIDLEIAPDCESGLQRLEGVDAVLLDLSFPEDRMQGEDALGILRRDHALLPVIILTQRNDFNARKYLLSEGACDYIYKWPGGLDDAEIAYAVKKAVQAARWKLFEKERQPAEGLLVGKSAASKRLMDEFDATVDAMYPVVITGDRGTGKSLFAAELHRKSNRRRNPPFIYDARERDLGPLAVPQDSTIILEHVDVVPYSDLRDLSATIPDRSRLIMTFGRRAVPDRQLFAYQLRLPSLSQRRADIPDLAKFFLGQYETRYALMPHTFGPGVLDVLQAREYPGNLGELQLVVEEAASAAALPQIEVADLPEALAPDWDPELSIPDVLGRKVSWHQVGLAYRERVRRECEERLLRLYEEIERRHLDATGQNPNHKDFMEESEVDAFKQKLCKARKTSAS